MESRQEVSRITGHARERLFVLEETEVIRFGCSMTAQVGKGNDEVRSGNKA